MTKALAHINKTYNGGYAFVEPEHIGAYAAATNDLSPAYEGDGAIAPPMLHVRLMRGLMWDIATDPDLDLDILRLVHASHDATFHKPLKPWDSVQVRARLEHVEQKSSGLVVASKLFGFVDGEAVVECSTAYFIRSKTPPEKKAPKAAPEPPPAPDWTRSVAIDPDQSIRYAAASLDTNPIHTDEAVAKAAGLPGCILHGLCTMAMGGASVLAEKGRGPADLRRLSVRFSRPVSNGTTLTVQGWDTGGGAQFQVLDASDKPVITAGVVEFG